ncbi:hypothetical protein [Legionella impletisoli]|uniref:Uncharacterized protein n=1 Tax=Legionella impletisoli TaxID=343510 RepID=A0A917JYP1_9GAMM|nr:hypothetical protein [Legionella impletisoli]GGI90213.1 hypothetical protein GCM10007966_18770 [Legionella impletisoli]
MSTPMRRPYGNWITIQGEVAETLTPSQQRTVEAPSFKLHLALYKSAYEKGFQTATRLRETLNEMLQKAFEEDEHTNSTQMVLA